MLSTFSHLISASLNSAVELMIMRFLCREHELLMDQGQGFLKRKTLSVLVPLDSACKCCMHWEQNQKRKKKRKNMKASLILTAACCLHAQFLQSKHEHELNVSWARNLPHAPPSSIIHIMHTFASTYLRLSERTDRFSEHLVKMDSFADKDHFEDSQPFLYHVTKSARCMFS